VRPRLRVIARRVGHRYVIRTVALTAPAGQQIALRCRGGGCPRRVFRLTGRGWTHPIRVKSLVRRRLRTGAVIEVAADGLITRWRLRRGIARRLA
jgi:hypothetical protein